MAKILVADDSAFMRKTLTEILNDEGHEVIGEAEEGHQALSLYKKSSPDVVIMDVVMPGTNGLEAVNAIMDLDPSAKIVMCTALGQKDIVRDAFYAGAKDYILKPFQAVNVKEVINKVLAL